jgi:hypothetical protein
MKPIDPHNDSYDSYTSHATMIFDQQVMRMIECLAQNSTSLTCFLLEDLQLKRNTYMSPLWAALTMILLVRHPTLHGVVEEAQIQAWQDKKTEVDARASITTALLAAIESGYLEELDS